MTLKDARLIADDVMNGNGHCYTVKQMRRAMDALWGAARIDYNRIEALEIGIASSNESADARLRNR